MSDVEQTQVAAAAAEMSAAVPELETAEFEAPTPAAAPPDLASSIVLPDWVADQVRGSIHGFELTARLLIILNTLLLAYLFNLLATAGNFPPPYLEMPLARAAGIVGALALLLSLLRSLAVVWPQTWRAVIEQPGDWQIFADSVLTAKSRRLSWAVGFFVLGMVLLTLVVVMAFLLVEA